MIKNGDNPNVSHTFPSSTESQSETNGYGHERLQFIINLMDLVDYVWATEVHIHNLLVIS
jgi:hypothetical protein